MQRSLSFDGLLESVIFVELVDCWSICSALRIFSFFLFCVTDLPSEISELHLQCRGLKCFLWLGTFLFFELEILLLLQFFLLSSFLYFIIIYLEDLLTLTAFSALVVPPLTSPLPTRTFILTCYFSMAFLSLFLAITLTFFSNELVFSYFWNFSAFLVNSTGSKPYLKWEE